MSSSDDALREAATSSLLELARGDRGARDRLFALLYDDLRARAAALLRRERPDHTLQTTALVHETYAHLIEQERIDVTSKGHFLALAAQAMRRILIDHARTRARGKRGDGRARVELAEEVEPGVSTDPLFLLSVDEALERLQERSERLARIVELRFFGGCTLEEVADALESSRDKVARDWLAARTLLSRSLAGEAGET